MGSNNSASTSREFGRECRTLKGEIVKSSAEITIADYLYQNNIKYVYEIPTEIKDRGLTKTIKPDFYLPDYGVYVEFWGLVETSDRSTNYDYLRKMSGKIDGYQRNNIKFISIYEKDLPKLDTIFKTELKKVTGISFKLRNPLDILIVSMGVYPSDLDSCPRYDFSFILFIHSSQCPGEANSLGVK